MTTTGEATIAEHLEWLRQRNLRPSTIVSRRNALRRMRRALDDLTECTEDDLERWAAGLQLGAAARATYISHAQQFFRWAHERDLIPADPTRRLAVPKVPPTLPRPMPEDDLQLAIAAAPDRIRPWLVLAAWAGLRACEIAALQRCDVRDHDTAPTLFIHGKGGKDRIVPMSVHVGAALREHGMPARGYLFRRLDGLPGPNQAWTISQLCNRHLHSLGIPDTLHASRHRFGTMTYQQCLDIRVVQELMGHARPSTTSGYVAYSNTSAIAAIAKLDAHLGLRVA